MKQETKGKAAKKKAKTAKAKTARVKTEKARERSAMKPATERMRVLAARLSAELAEWPGVTMKRAFGMMLAYRGKVIFGALPDTKAIYQEDAIMLKFAEEKPALIKRMEAEALFLSPSLATGRKSKSEGRKWRFFLMREDGDVHIAISWLAEAYELARNRKK